MLPKVKREKRRRLLISSCLCLAGIVGGWFGFQYFGKSRTPTWDGVEIPSGGLKLRPETWNQAGNPEDAVEDLKKMYATLIDFRRKNGRLPQLRELMDWDGKHPGPGKLTKEDWTTPDMHLGPGKDPQENDGYAFNFRTKRPDGKEKPAFPKEGERDVWVYCDSYVRMRQTVFRDGKESLQPSGEYVVLWSDGKIERVPTMNKVLFKESERVYSHAFSGQTGLPEETLTYGEFLRQRGNITIK